MSDTPVCTSRRPPDDWTPLKSGAYGFVGRVGEAAMKGGAEWGDVWQMMLRLGFDLTLNQALTEAAPLAASRLKSIQALREKDSRKSAEERDRVTAADRSAAHKYPVKTERHREIARQLNMKPDRVRYILEGRRSRKK